MGERWLSRRQFLRAGSLSAAVGGLGWLGTRWPGRDHDHTSHAEGHTDNHAATPHGPAMTVGDVDTAAMGYDPSEFLTTFDYGTISVGADGQTVREFTLTAFDKEIEIAPGVFFPAWTYNGQVPGPTLRCNEGDLVRVNFVNAGSHPHTIHFHASIPPPWTGCRGSAAAISSPARRSPTSSGRSRSAATFTTATACR